MGLPGRERSLTISSAVWIQYTNVTDKRTDTGRLQRPRLRIVSRGKNKVMTLGWGKEQLLEERVTQASILYRCRNLACSLSCWLQADVWTPPLRR